LSLDSKPDASDAVRPSPGQADTDVLVVGAGPTGLTLAAGLLGRGVRVRVIDRADRANPHSKAVILWPRALEVFQALGVGQQMFDQGVRFIASSYYTGGRLIGRLRMRPLTGTRFPLAVSLPQSDTEALVRAEVERRGGVIEFGTGLVSFEQAAAGVDALLSDGSTIRASWLVGCDGGHSTVRDAMGVPFEGSTYPQTFMLVDGRFDTEYAHNESYYVMHPKGVIVILGLPDGRYRAFASMPLDTAPEQAEAEVIRVVRENSPRRMALVEATGSGTFQVHRKMATRLREGRLMIAGDAAHIHSPAGGVGMNTGVQDAHALAWRLAAIVRGELGTEELDAWETERLSVAHGVIAETDRQTRMWMVTGWRRRLRDVLITIGLRTTVMERVLPQRLAQLRIVVPADGPALRRLRPGARIRDTALPDGSRLHDRFADGGYLLLGFGASGAAAIAELGRHSHVPVNALALTDAPAAVGIAAVSDPGARLRRAIRAPRQGVCLVRPDAVIAAAGRADNAACLDAIRSRLSPAATEPATTRPATTRPAVEGVPA